MGYLDSLRGFAANIVVWSHFVLSYQTPQVFENFLTLPFLHLLWDGSAAVILFFVLSGYVLSLKFFRNLNTRSLEFREIQEFVIVRLGRLWFPYVFAVGLSFIVKTLLFSPLDTVPAQTIWIKSFWQNETHFRHFLLENNLFFRPTLFTLLPHGWSLFFEMTISSLIPIAVFLSLRTALPLSIFALILVFKFGFPVFILHFLFGLLLAKQLKQYKSKPHWNSYSSSALLIVSLLLFSFRFSVIPYISTPVPNQWIEIIVGVGAAGIIYTASVSLELQKFLNFSAFRYLGRISYSLYLCHFFVLLAITPRVIRWTNTQLPGVWYWGWGVGILFTTLFSWIISIAINRLIEVPSLNFTKKVSKYARIGQSRARVDKSK